MANSQHLEILKTGVKAWNKWREENPVIEPDLTGSNLSKGNLRDVNLSETDLRWADLRWADCRGADFNGSDLRHASLIGTIFNLANLSEANLSETYLSGADLSEADLRKAYFVKADLTNVDLSASDIRRADFRWAYLIKAKFNDADLRGANLIEANLSKSELKRTNFNRTSMAWSYFGDIDLSTAKGLRSVRHYGPSTIGVDTIYRSKGNIPEEFLKGTGVPDKFITYTSSLNPKAYEHHSCFISYTGRDRDFIERLNTDLRHEGIRCWSVPEEMKMGNEVQQRVGQLIRIHDKLLLVISKHSVESSWIQKEVEIALDVERNFNKTIIFALYLDHAQHYREKAWAQDLQQSHPIFDFSNWNAEDTYRTEFERLLDNIKCH
jgi:hypothetical protein